MAEPRWAQYYERRDAANHPDGNEDIYNRAMRDFYATSGIQHNDDGSHKVAGFMVVEEGQYTGSGAGQVVALRNFELDITFLLISRPDTEQPVFISADMTNTKQVGTNAFQAGMITDITTTGQFTVGTDAAVDEISIVYSYLVIGSIA